VSKVEVLQSVQVDFVTGFFAVGSAHGGSADSIRELERDLVLPSLECVGFILTFKLVLLYRLVFATLTANHA